MLLLYQYAVSIRRPDAAELDRRGVRPRFDVGWLYHRQFQLARVSSLFPPTDSYRDIPLVLRASDYRGGPTSPLDKEQLRDDFNCMSFVGTQGWSFEKGLGAAKEATSIEKVGTFYDPDAEPPQMAPENAPNFGLVRQDAQFALIFVTDENDCTYKNDRNEMISEELKIREQDAGQCLDDICDFANSTQVDPATSPLIPTDEIATSIMDNLSDIKGETVSVSDFIVASIHGIPERYSGPDFSKDECKAAGYEEVQTSCDTPEFGTAFSGDRYQRFVENFDEDRRFPQPGDPVQGKMCRPEFIGETLTAIGELIASGVDVCINERVYRCSDASQCPSHPFTNEPSQCLPFASSGESYCRSAIQLIMTATEETVQKTGAADAQTALTNTGYCIESTINADGLQDSCVVSRDRYTLSQCAANDNGLAVNWNNENYFDVIGEFNVEINYAVTPEVSGDQLQ